TTSSPEILLTGKNPLVCAYISCRYQSLRRPRTCRWPLVVTQRRKVFFLAVPVSSRVREGASDDCLPRGASPPPSCQLPGRVKPGHLVRSAAQADPFSVEYRLTHRAPE